MVYILNGPVGIVIQVLRIVDSGPLASSHTHIGTERIITDSVVGSDFIPTIIISGDEGVGTDKQSFREGRICINPVYSTNVFKFRLQYLTGRRQNNQNQKYRKYFS